MKISASVVASAAVLVFSATVEADNLYTKNSPVLQVTAKTYGNLIAKSNHTSIVEFYAPWCGHCQSLKPAFEKAAQKLKGLAKVAAVNCDNDDNKPFCGEMGVKGFPTLKIVRPSKRTGRPIIEEYQGARSAKALVDAVVEKIPNHVKRVTDKSINAWLKESNETAKAVLFTEKGTTSALLRALAIDFLGAINFGQVRNKEANAVEEFGVTEYPSFILLPGGDKESIVYSGEMKKEAMSEFLSQIALPNPDPAPQKSTKPKGKQEKKTKKTKIPDPVDEKKPKEADQANAATESEDASKKAEDAQPLIPAINDEATLQKKCLLDTSKICALVLLPNFDPKKDEIPEGMIEGLRSMAEVYDKHNKRRSSFPFYLVEPSLPLVTTLREQLGLKSGGELDLVAVNAKRGWFQKYAAADFKMNSVEAWVDSIRMNEGKKEELPKTLVASEAKEEVKEEVKEESTPEAETKKPAMDSKKDKHDEL